jgi:hypothetical protein
MFKKLLVLSLLALLVALPARAQPFVNYKVTPAVAGSLIVCTSPPGCTMFSASVRSGAAAGFLLIIPQATVPGDGAVTPSLCIDVAANSSVVVVYDKGIGFPAGMVAVFSTTGCFTKTISNTAFISVAAQ